MKIFKIKSEKKKQKHRLAHMGTHLPYGHTVIN